METEVPKEENDPQDKVEETDEFFEEEGQEFDNGGGGGGDGFEQEDFRFGPGRGGYR